MLKLTLIGDRGFVWVWPQSLTIESPAEYDGLRADYGSSVRVNDSFWFVKETPEEILAMPEMRAEIDRAKHAAYPVMHADAKQVFDAVPSGYYKL